MKNKVTKKSLSVILSLIMALSALSMLTVTTFAKISGEYEYAVLDDGTAEITAYYGSETELTIPSTLDGLTVTSLDGYVFYNCDPITSITIPNSVTKIGDHVFYNCKSLTSITIPNSVKSIGKYAFEQCTSLKIITIPNSVTSLGDFAFSNCDSLESITIPKSVKSIGYCAFSFCSSLTSITVDDNNTEYSSAEGVLFNRNKTEIICFPVSKAETTYIIPKSVTTIQSNAFTGCSRLTSVIIPESVVTIGFSSFSNCDSITTITIPNSVTSINNYAFYSCDSLASITIPDSVTSIGRQPFSRCFSLAGITVEDNNKNYSSEEGVLFNKGKTEIICYPAAKTETAYTIPDSVTNIGDYSFEFCKFLTSIEIPDSVTKIGESAFSNCESLTSIEIPDSIKSIGEYAFFDCNSLTSVTIGSGVSYIVDGTFMNCISLKSIIIPNNVTLIDNYAVGFYISYTSYDLVESLIIYGYTDSAAEKYAIKNHINFVDLNNPVPAPSFPDVPKNVWFYDAATYCAEKGFITGYSNGKFGPADNLKRQDFVVILARIAGADLSKYENVTSKMPDVKKGSYYAAAVNWAVDNHIINGYNNGKFGVGDNITREQVATILYRYMGSPAVTGADATLKPFADAGKISPFAKDAVVWAIQNGVISGKKPDTLAPTATASRAEIATIVMRMDQKGMFAA